MSKNEEEEKKVEMIEGVDLSGSDEDDSMLEEEENCGKHQFDNLIKSMLARLEFTGSLAPV